MADRRTYGQFCGLASALDVLGERWTMLIVRELLIGPRRFSELADNLPGVGPNLLADRLRVLTEHGVVVRSDVDGDGRGRLYELTELGEDLRQATLDLAGWGMRFAAGQSKGISRPEWGFLAVQALMRPDSQSAVDETYEFRVDSQTFHISVQGGSARAARGSAENPAMVVVTNARTFVEIGARTMTAAQAETAGKLRMTGDPGAIARCSELLGLVAG